MRKLMLVVAACGFAACDGQTVTGPDPVPQETVVQTEPAPVVQPVAPPAAGPVWEVWGTTGSTLHVRYDGSSPYAQYETYYTTFDDQNTKLGVQRHDIGKGTEQTRVFKPCVQADAEQVGVKPIGHAFFDKDGRPFDSWKSPEKVAECRRPTPPCQGELCGPTPNPTPSPSPSPTPSPTPSPVPTPTPQPTPTPAPSPTPSPSPSPSPTPTPSPTPGLCYYNVDGDNAAAEEASCLEAGGIWLNFVQGALHNHCQFNLPGVSLCDFQITPGQSANGCLSKPTGNACSGNPK